MLVALAGCGNPSIEEGTVYKKEHTEKHNILIPEKRGFSIVQQPYFQSERWEIYIAQCPKGEIPEQEKSRKNAKQIHLLCLRRYIITCKSVSTQILSKPNNLLGSLHANGLGETHWSSAANSLKYCFSALIVASVAMGRYFLKTRGGSKYSQSFNQSTRRRRSRGFSVFAFSSSARIELVAFMILSSI
jgi:hypothetical protein